MQPNASLPAAHAFRMPAIPGALTLANLFIGGFTGLAVWEVWAKFVTPLVIGGPLEPPGLVISLAKAVFDYPLTLGSATYIHWGLGIVGYPVLYYLISRSIKSYGAVLDALVLAAFTAFLAFRFTNGTATTAMLLFWAVVAAVTATRLINPNPRLADAVSWGAFTWFNALGIMAPIAGLPFLLMDWGGQLSFMSYVGHMIFGFMIAVVFEYLEGRRERPAPMHMA